jgi:NDP-sugar pyrophosphorylase family protein
MNYKVVIPTAGLGSRLKNISKHINKALVTIANRPAICFIIEKFPENVEIVIPLGYKKETVKDFLLLAYPNRKFTFVEVDPYEGEGSGLGLTLLTCKEHLQVPFIFCSNDTIVTDEIPEPDYNWMGYADINETEQYRSIRFENNSQIVEICSKGAKGNVKPYIGLAGIKDFDIFWDAMIKGQGDGSIEVGESYGLRFLIDKGIIPLKFTWFDTGNIDSLQKSRVFFHQSDSPNILEKEEEAIWFVNDKVIKFSVDKEFIKNRVKRVEFLGSYVPSIINHSENMYAYYKVEGEIFSRNPTLPNFNYFLSWIDRFWEKRELADAEKIIFKNICLDFYKNKTLKRVKQYFTRFEQIDSDEIINGYYVPKLFDIFNKLDWDYIADGVPVRFHGDLHFENILIRNEGTPPFALLDWRQDFGALLEYGDIYYDLAKLLHGLIISHEIINNNQFTINHRLNQIDFDFHRKNSLIECQNILSDYIKQRGYDLKKVELITALIFLNIAPLHHYPYTKLLFYLGKTMLFNIQENIPRKLYR